MMQNPLQMLPSNEPSNWPSNAMTAIISHCGTYRYRLERLLQRDMLSPASRGPIAFMMLNPSTADHTQDDPTIRRCTGFARSWGCDRYAVSNLYALRSPKPSALALHDDPVGPDNDAHLAELAGDFRDIVCAWGAGAEQQRVQVVVSVLRQAGARLWCLGTTKDGSPRHPLYVRGDQPLLPWDLPSH